MIIRRHTKLSGSPPYYLLSGRACQGIRGSVTPQSGGVTLDLATLFWYLLDLTADLNREAQIDEGGTLTVQVQNGRDSVLDLRLGLRHVENAVVTEGIMYLPNEVSIPHRAVSHRLDVASWSGEHAP
jgi:hypothetical protein